MGRPLRSPALALALVIVAAAAQQALAQSPAGQIAGLVTDAGGTPLANITVAAAPVSSPDTLTVATTGAGGRYVLEVAPGTYDVAFNSEDPVNDAYDTVTYGGRGPAPGALCTVCGGAAVNVTDGATTSGIDAALRSPPFPQVGNIRPLSGNSIRVVGGRVSFSLGCHIEPTGCLGSASLRLASGGPALATVRVFVEPNHVGRLVFKVPAAVQSRIRRTKRHALAAVVEVSAPPSHTVTRFLLVER